MDINNNQNNTILGITTLQDDARIHAVNKGNPIPKKINFLENLKNKFVDLTSNKFTISQGDVGDPIADTPSQYVDIIKQKAKQYNIPANILSSLIKNESGFNANAKNVNSREASYGLAQINTKVHPITESQAKDPNFAIDFAAKRLAEMIKRYGFNEGIQAYNTPGAIGSTQLKNYADKIIKTASSTPDGLGIKTQTKKITKNLKPNKLASLGNVTTGYGESTKYEKFHPGIDIANKKGTIIPSVTDGKITSVITGKQHGDNGFGNQVVITDSQGNKHQYSHLDKVLAMVGQSVSPGQPIASMGDTGSTYSPSGQGTGTHLDYRIVSAYNKYINPYTYLSKKV